MKKIICVAAVLTAVIFTMWCMCYGGIWGISSAISKVGLEHHFLFCLWGISTFFALAFNICVSYSATKYKFYIPLLCLSGIGMILTLSCDFDYSHYSQYIAHCIGSLGFSAIMGITVFLLFYLTKQYLFSIICAVILLTDLVLLIIYKQNFLIETVPIFVGYILLLINNFRRAKLEARL